MTSLTVGQKVAILPISGDSSRRYTEVIEIGKRKIKTADGRVWVARTMNEWGAVAKSHSFYTQRTHIVPLTDQVEERIAKQLNRLKLERMQSEIRNVKLYGWSEEKVLAVHAAMTAAGAFE